MPVGSVTGRERPFQIRPRRPALDMRIFGDVNVVVVVKKRILRRREEYEKCQSKQQKADEKSLPPGGNRRFPSFPIFHRNFIEPV